jgi:Transglutaminase-like superfamily/TgpA N-terminal domain
MIPAARVVGAVLLLAGAVQLATGWAGASALLVLGAAALVPYGLLLLGAGLRLPPALTTLAVLSLMAVAGLVTGTFSGAALRDAIPRLLTAPRPAPPTADLLLPGVLLAAMVGLFAGIRATRPRGGLFAPVAGAAVLYVGGALLSAGRSDRYGLVAALLAACAVAGWAMLERPVRQRSAVLVRAMPGIALAAAATALIAAALPAGGEFEPRQLVSPPPLPLVERNPLPRLAALAKQADQELFRHTGGDQRLHLVALAGFDGAVWQAGAQYRPVGAVAPVVLPAGQKRTRFSMDITIEALDGPWLPTRGTPTAVTLPDARVDADSGSLLVAGVLRTGLRYQVAGTVDTPADADLAVAGAPRAAAYLGIPRLPYLFAQYVQRIANGAKTPFEQAVLIESAVREGRRMDLNAPAGSSYARLEMFLFGSAGQPGAQVGTSEQFATAFTVLARAVGLPTRVMVGFCAGERGPDGTRVVRGRDALAWPEVYFTGQGWVPFNPTPAARDNAGAADDTKRQVLDRVGQNQPPPPKPKPAAARPKPIATASAPPAAKKGEAGTSGGIRLAQVGQVGSAGAATILAALALARGLRRGRHRRSGPRGAWSEVLDLLVLLGRRPAGWRDAQWIAADLAAAVPLEGAHPAVRLATYADRAAFAPAGSLVDSPWPELRRLRRAARRTVPWHRRLTWPVDPRPLLRR